MQVRVRTSGRTKRGCDTQLSNMRAVNKATPSCLCCSVWAYRTPLRKCGSHWKKENGCSRSLMMCMCCVHQSEPASSVICLAEDSGNALTSGCIPVRRAPGISQGERPADLADLGPDVWNPLGIKILGTPVGHDEFVANFLAERLAEEQK